MSFIWIGMVFVSVIVSLFSGTSAALASAALTGAGSAVTLALSIAGVLCLWSGVSKVMETSGLSRLLTKLLSPVLRRLFPDTARDETALGYISANVTANLLGLGNAATPLGIQAVQRMKELSGSQTASDEMCLLIVMNTASIQLIPTTVAAVRASCGAAAAFDILPAVWVTSACSVSAGLIAAKLLRRIWRS